MTGQVIEEMLGPNWWEREHDPTALCALLDRVMEEENCTRGQAYRIIRETTRNAKLPSISAYQLSKVSSFLHALGNATWKTV